MRIIAGQNRGRALTSLGKGDAGAHLRPTTDRVRESLFNVLTSGRFEDPIIGARVLDLFAGTGALGLEALSRGAASAYFVDDGAKSLALLRRNVALCNADGKSRIIRRDARRLGPHSGPACTLVFLDPPYGKNLGAAALSAAMAQGWIAPGALIVWEESSTVTPPAGITQIESRKYGDTFISILRADPQQDQSKEG